MQMHVMSSLWFPALAQVWNSVYGNV